jgi:hypothetical protein
MEYFTRCPADETPLRRNVIEIDWGKYGQYVLTVDPATKTMVGSTKGNAADWRRCAYVRDLAAKPGGSEHDHLH